MPLVTTPAIGTREWGPSIMLQATDSGFPTTASTKTGIDASTLSAAFTDATTEALSAPTGTQPQSSKLPAAILPSPSSGAGAAPSGNVLIRIGFLRPLNYSFVAEHMEVAAEIFHHLPKAFSNRDQLPAEPQIIRLLPYDSQSRWGYITTLAQLYYPKGLVKHLQSDIKDHSSSFYYSNIQMVDNITALINSDIPIFGDLDSSGTGGSGNPFESTNNGGQSKKKQASVAGIAVGSVGGVSLYVTAVFYFFRRWKHKRSLQGNLHKDIQNCQRELRHSDRIGGFKQTRDREGRLLVSISRPMRTKNSLGWDYINEATA